MNKTQLLKTFIESGKDEYVMCYIWSNRNMKARQLSHFFFFLLNYVWAAYPKTPELLRCDWTCLIYVKYIIVVCIFKSWSQECKMPWFCWLWSWPLLEVTGDVSKFSWHDQSTPDRLRYMSDHVLNVWQAWADKQPTTTLYYWACCHTWGLVVSRILLTDFSLKRPNAYCITNILQPWRQMTTNQPLSQWCWHGCDVMWAMFGGKNHYELPSTTSGNPGPGPVGNIITKVDIGHQPHHILVFLFAVVCHVHVNRKFDVMANI